MSRSELDKLLESVRNAVSISVQDRDFTKRLYTSAAMVSVIDWFIEFINQHCDPSDLTDPDICIKIEELKELLGLIK